MGESKLPIGIIVNRSEAAESYVQLVGTEGWICFRMATCFQLYIGIVWNTGTVTLGTTPVVNSGQVDAVTEYGESEISVRKRWHSGRLWESASIRNVKIVEVLNEMRYSPSRIEKIIGVDGKTKRAAA